MVGPGAYLLGYEFGWRRAELPVELRRKDVLLGYLDAREDRRRQGRWPPNGREVLRAWKRATRCLN